MHFGVGERGFDALVSEELPDGGDTAARIEQLCGTGMAQTMGIDLDLGHPAEFGQEAPRGVVKQ